MAWIRLGDRIITSERPEFIGDPISSAENLSMRVFDASISPFDVKDYYLQSYPPAQDSKVNNFLLGYIPRLGEFEALLISKFLNPPIPVLCVVGSMGSGKTTTIRYLLDMYKNLILNTFERQPQRTLLVSVIDFNEHPFLAYNDNQNLSEALYHLIVDELSARWQILDNRLKEIEFTKFWDHEFKIFKSGKSSSLAFRRFANILGSNSSGKTSGSARPLQEVNRRREALQEIGHELPLLLDYYIRLWRYFVHTHYKDLPGKGLIVFDNLDALQPFIQRRLLEIVYTHAQVDGPTFVLSVRPETFYQLGMGTGVIDVVNHIGPSPQRVIEDRINRFCLTPKRFYHPLDGLAEEDFNQFVNYFRRIKNKVERDTSNPLIRFFEIASGDSIRTGLLIAQNLFRISSVQLRQNNLQLHDLVRTCIAGSPRQLKWTNRNPIEHLFNITGNRYKNVYLVKPRILRYLAMHPKGQRRLNEIVNTLWQFGHDDLLIKNALNDLLRIYSQLIRSSGFDFYRTNEPWKEHEGHQVVLTKMGYGYTNHLIKDLSYIQEIMLDTWVNGENFPIEINYNYLSEKFTLLYHFLNELYRIDIEEVDRFLKTWGPKAYYDTFGTRLITLDIIQGIHNPVKRILNSEIKKYPQYEDLYKEVIDKFDSLTFLVEASNSELLGISVESSVNNDH